MATTDKTRHRNLTVQQRNAVDLLVQGKNDRETAEAIGVSRQTVWGWRRDNAAFVAVLNRQRQEIWGAQIERLRGLVARAVDTLEAELDGDNALHAAVHVLKAVRLYGHESLPPRGSTAAAEIERQWADEAEQGELDRIRKERDRERHRLFAAL